MYFSAMLTENNKKENVAGRLEEYLVEGGDTYRLVTGYFDVLGLVWLARLMDARAVPNLDMVLGEIVHKESEQPQETLDLLNANLNFDRAFTLSDDSRLAIAFLRRAQVRLRTLEPHFCHAKLHILPVRQASDKKSFENYALIGSSNLTAAGLGLKRSSNLELNEFIKDDRAVREYTEWFASLWQSKKTHNEKILPDGTQKDLKTFLIEEIERLLKAYTPKQVYEKMLYEIFSANERHEDVQHLQENKNLRESRIYQVLYPFQRTALQFLLEKLEQYGCAILGDAVGLGKTFTALAVLKHYQNKGYKTYVLCPKRLEYNWEKYQEYSDSILEEDNLEYEVFFHTDLAPSRNEDKKAPIVRNLKGHKAFLKKSVEKLIVIDESHNLRNQTSGRYEVLYNYLKDQPKCKVLMLSATPINNDFNDLRNQLLLLAHGDETFFQKHLGLNNDLAQSFRGVSRAFKEWQKEENRTVRSLSKKLDKTDLPTIQSGFVLARTRRLINQNLEHKLPFPHKDKAEARFLNFPQLGKHEHFADILADLPQQLAAYQPTRYTLTPEQLNERKRKIASGEYKKDEILKDQVNRDVYLVKLMHMLFAKRLESSWFAFYCTVNNILEYFDEVLERSQQKKDLSEEETNFKGQGGKKGNTDPELEEEELSVGRRNPVSFSEMERSGRLSAFQEDLHEDIRQLRQLQAGCKTTHQKIEAEKSPDFSADPKLRSLMGIIQEVQGKPVWKERKLLIFTAYTDTAEYLYEELRKRGFKKLGIATGKGCKADNDPTQEWNSKLERILQRFAPYTKLYLEQDYPEWEKEKKEEHYEEWKEWMKAQKDEKGKAKFPKRLEALENPIEILIASDVLSEGQNLQDCGTLINYDIHWNPVRIIQRAGRIDRIGSPHKRLKVYNFWPTKDVEDYIKLRKRVTERGTSMQATGAEVGQGITEDFEGDTQEREQMESEASEKLLRQLGEGNIDDLLDAEQGENIGLDVLAFNALQQDYADLREQKKKPLPDAVFSGFLRRDAEVFPEAGLLALVRSHDAEDKNKKYYKFVYLNTRGELQKEFSEKSPPSYLRALREYRDADRHLPKALKENPREALMKYAEQMNKWARSLAAKQGTQSFLSQKKQNKKAKASASAKVQAAFKDPEQIELVAWFAIS